MQIPLATTFKDLDGNTPTKNNVEGGPPLTVKDVFIVAVTMEFPDDSKDPSKVVDDKLKRFALYQKLLEASGEIDLTSEEAVYLKPRVGRCFNILVAGPVLKLLDGNKTPPPKAA